MSSTKQESYEKYIALIGDSIFDNKSYVGIDSPDVTSQLNMKTKHLNWNTINCAVDGSITEAIIANQIHFIPTDVNTIIVSSGGNDGLFALHELTSSPTNWLPWNLCYLFYKTRQNFQSEYRKTLQTLSEKFPSSNIICCTIYYPMFMEYNVVLQMISNIGVNIMGSVIINEALKYGNIPIIDLRHIFDKKEDYANSIEPGVPGGDKLTNNIIHVLNNHDFNQKYTKINDLRYALTEYSENMNPFGYTNRYWPGQEINRQQGSMATVFFRRAFNNRENGNIRVYFRFGMMGIATVSVGYLMLKYKRKFL